MTITTNCNNNDPSEPRIILASASPRRREIMNSHGIDVRVMPTDTDESLPDGIGMEAAVETLSARKAKACFDSLRPEDDTAGCLIIAADTIVWKDEIMGKPEDHDDAYRMLDKIRGTFHYVVTGVTLIDTDTGAVTTLCDVTKVWCKAYTDEDISDYISREEPYDKAGSYAIQGYFGRYIDHIEGDYENVVGLPYYRIADMIARYE